MRGARILFILLAGTGALSSLLAMEMAPGTGVAIATTCYDVTVDVPPYHPGVTVCPPVATADAGDPRSGA